MDMNLIYRKPSAIRSRIKRQDIHDLKRKENASTDNLLDLDFDVLPDVLNVTEKQVMEANLQLLTTSSANILLPHFSST